MTATALYSDSWHRVSKLRPRLRSHIHIHRHVYRGEVWYVMQDQSNGEFHRYTPDANLLISLMDGRRSVQEIWEIVCTQLEDDAMPQDEVIRLLAQLHRADVMMTDRAPDARDLVQRRRRQRRQKIMQYIGNPSALKLPLLDPDRWLQIGLPYYRWLFTSVGALLWLGVMIWGGALGAMHWQELTDNVWDQVFSAGNILAMALVYPVVKALHELGHACAIKVRGGQVHEIGVMLLLLVPIPYVDASAALAFTDKRWRILVGAAGILVELFLAALAMIVWVQLEPGLGRSLAYNVIVLCGISTLFINGNPLLRYDGYYMLSDAIEIPNLGQRANAWLGYLFKRYVLRLAAVAAPRASRGEQVWFVGYAVVSFCYRMFIMFLAVFLMAGQFFFFGVLLAIWATINTIALPLWRLGRQLLTDPQIQARRTRSYAISGLCALALLALVGVLPMPDSTDTEGVIWVPPSAEVWAPAAGFVRASQVVDDSPVKADAVLLTLDNEELKRRKSVLDAQVDEYQARYVQANAQNPVQAAIMQRHWQALLAEKREVQIQVDSLQVRSPHAGRYVPAQIEEMTDRYVERGETLGYVLMPADTVRVVVPQSSLERIHRSLKNVRVRLIQDRSEEFVARIAREVPAATDELPSLALSLQAGGAIGVDPRKSQEGLAKAVNHLFVMDLELPAEAPRSYLGARVYVKFSHESRPIALQAYDVVRQMVLQQLKV